MTDPTKPRQPARRPPWGRLAFRFVVALGAGAVVVLAATAWWSLGVQRRHLTDLVHASADRISDFVRRSTRDGMLRNDPEAVGRIVETIGGQPGIRKIRVIDKQGRIRVATLASDVGTTVDRDADQCTICHRPEGPLERPERRDRVRVYDAPGGGRILGVVAPIPNEPACSTADCHAHDPAQSVLGVLDVQVSLDTVDADVAASQRQMAVGLLASVAAMLALSALLLWVLVVRPVHRLRGSVNAAAKGDLTVPAPVTFPDEVGDLTTAWNSLLGELARARGELESWNQTLETRLEEKSHQLEAAHRNMMQVEKMASLGKLAAVVAHELNNPLAGIATYAKLLRKRLSKQVAAGGAPDDDSARALELVETEAVRCGDIVRNLLMFSRTPTAHFSEQDVAPYLERVLLLLRHRADLQSVRMSLEVAPGMPRIVCDAAQIQQATLALATNAIEAMPSGGTLTIRLGPAPGDPESFLLEVRDTGVGIAEKDLPHVFEPFFSTKEQGKGVGLGLAVVYGIVTRHHGTIDVESSPERGTTFRLRIPLRPPPEVEPLPAAATPPGGMP